MHSLNQPLMNPHLKRIPRLTPLTTWRLPRRNFQRFRRQAHGAFDAQILCLGALDQLLTDFFERLHFAGGERDSNLVDFLGKLVSKWRVGWSVERGYGAIAELLLGFLVGHIGSWWKVIE